jgi:ribosomal-protein-alanine N-acetyltransferase
VIDSRAGFAARCRARDRERQLGTGSGFGVFIGSRFVGEINLNGLQRGPFQTAQIGYWVDEQCAGKAIVPEAFVVLCRHAFEDLVLHRIEVAIIPRNRPSRRVMEKLGIREEGIAERYLEINGRWEDHVRFGITAEEWEERRDELVGGWIARDGVEA